MFHAKMKTSILHHALALVLGCLAFAATPASAASRSDKKLVGHWISFADSKKGTHQPADIIMLTFNRAGAFAWQEQSRTLSGHYIAESGRFVLTDAATGESLSFAYRFYDDDLIVEGRERLTTTFLKTKQGAGEVEAILAKIPKPEKMPEPKIEPVEVVKIKPSTPQPEPAEPKKPSRAADTRAKAECRKHLERIYVAIQAHRKEHKDTPDHLSSLVPKYLSAHDLLCPSGKHAGELLFGLEDPKLTTSYTYEFANRPVPAAYAGGAAITMKAWRQRVMSLVGGATPIVRCHLHDEVLNISFDGEFYESGREWEQLPRFSDMIDIGKLAPNR